MILLDNKERLLQNFKLLEPVESLLKEAAGGHFLPRQKPGVFVPLLL